MIKKIEEHFFRYPVLFYSLYLIFSIRPAFEVINPKYGKYVTLVHGIFILWAILILGCNILSDRKFLKNKSVLLVIAFGVISIFTIIVNRNLINMNAIKTIILTMLFMAVMLIGYDILSRKYSKSQIIKYVFYPVIAVKLVISVISLILYLFNINIFSIFNGELNYLGMRFVENFSGNYSPLLYGLYKEPNYSAMFAISILVIIVYVLLSKKLIKSSVEKVFLIVSFAAEYIYLALTNSRGAMLAIGLILVVIVSVEIYRAKKITGKFLSKSVIKKVVVVLVVVVSWISIEKIGFLTIQNSELRKYLITENKQGEIVYGDYDTVVSEHRIGNTGKSDYDAKKLKNNVIDGKEDSTEEIGNGRLSIWRDALILYKKSPLFGIGPDMQQKNSERYTNLDIPNMKNGKSVVNSYLNLLLSFGGFAFILIVGWLSYVYVKIFKADLINERKDEYLLFYGSGVLLVTYFFLEAVFVNINYQQAYIMFMIGLLINVYGVYGKNEDEK